MRLPAFLLIGLFLAATATAQEAPVRRIFHVKYVAEGVVYLDGGRNAGLTERQLLKVSPPGIEEGSSRGEQLAAEEVASVRVLSLADASAVCEILSSNREVHPGDVALLVAGAKPAAPAAKAERPYLQVVSFTTDDPLDPLEEEQRAAVPRPPLPEINRARGRIGVEYNTLLGHDPVPSRSSTAGLVLRANMTRLGGTYWNFNGYWRGRLNRRGGSQVRTVSDLLNRTYQLGFTYNNPFSSHIAGVGRLYLPWASSLDILDGGYIGLRSAKGTVTSIFAGTTPDPTSWDYSPNRKLAGTFFAIERGSFDAAHFLSTTGVAVSAIDWRSERQFAFTENTFSYRHVFTAYESLQVDAPHSYTAANPSAPSTPVTTRFGGINRSYMTLRWQPYERLSFDLNHSYFRGVPTFDPVLIGTGLLDRYLFQGFSGGLRAEVIKRITLYTNVGRSSRSGDAQPSWNRLYGVTFADFLHTDFRVDTRYSQFVSPFGQGRYESLSVSRQMGESVRVELLGGMQKLRSTLAANSASHFVTSSLDWSPGRHLFLQTFYTRQRGSLTNYDQFSIVMGSRF
jgi:hypothetical protein